MKSIATGVYSFFNKESPFVFMMKNESKRKDLIFPSLAQSNAAKISISFSSVKFGPVLNA